MKITLKMLERTTKTHNRACEDGIVWFQETFEKGYADHTQIIRKLNKERIIHCWEGWLLKAFNLSGVARVYCSNGRVAIEERYKDGHMHGITKTFYNYGKLYSVKYFKNGMFIRQEVKT